ncbi:Zn-dependent peptidase ImmA (M78 family) [Rhodopirellula rubra]|uniref:Zn-dependent peptidase ImmA (M78 family) n=1 Tax=Aporhodopirellula rubra TaxID=980271 RepID=A0A7W5DW63_9BACT|nr:ImmA/IrrE family metallo-endopeptidase [Aporhodopirellula rubra]MBB3205520.1 Zn-dependent peptidase ImmA (M78 family) [Aporhodopirellula rubra]
MSPIDLHLLAELKGVVDIAPREMKADGYLGVREDGAFVIRHRAGARQTRTRFTIAHEIAHILLAEVEGQSLNRDGNYRRDASEEMAVNRIAAELLIPELIVSREIRRDFGEGRLPRWSFVFHLAKRFNVSCTAMVLRLLELPSINAISFRVSIEGLGQHNPFCSTENKWMRLANGVDYEMDRVWRESRRTNKHQLAIALDGQELTVDCEGELREFATRLGDAKVYWLVGWHVPGFSG